MACTTVKPNSEQPIFGNKVYQYKGWIQFCLNNPQDVDCKKGEK